MKYKFLKEMIIILIILLLSILLNYTKINNVITIYFCYFDSFVYIFITLLVFYYFIITIIDKNHLTKLIIVYSIFIIIILFFRKQSFTNIQKDFYLIKWLKLLFTNRTVFINVFGNILIFLPLGFILKCLLKNIYLVLLFVLLIIIILEFIQFKTLLGIFDIVDIILNYVGALIGIIGERRAYERRTK